MEERIQKIIARAGVASRRACERLIDGGHVKVNNNVVSLGSKANAERDRITVDGKLLPPREKNVYLMLNKPRGYVTTVSERFGMPTVMNLISIPQRVYPVGRLDRNSEGLLLLTNDGDLAYTLTHPRFECSKTYVVRLGDDLNSADMDMLLRGVVIDGRRVCVSRLRRLRPKEVLLDIHEGRKHIVRRVFEELDYVVVQLTRIAVGPLRLQRLRLGEWRMLTSAEVRLLRVDRFI